VSLKTLKPRVETIDTRKGASPATTRIRGRALETIRDRILLRDCYTCKRCGLVSARNVVDHVVPLHLGGAESDSNRQTLCIPCHDAKSAREEKNRELGATS